MQAVTWKDRITDGANLWLNATRIEENGDFAEAAVFYLKDGADCLKHGMAARAALSCSCAANCLEKVGDMNAARNLYFEAGKIYEETADSVFGDSIREALWLMQEAHDQYLLGGDEQKATETYERCVRLIRKVSPFDTGSLANQLLRVRKSSDIRAPGLPKSAPQTSDVKNAVEVFLRMRDVQPAASGGLKRGAPERRFSDEKSIIS